MVAREGLARLELDLKSPAVLAAVSVAREEKRVGHLAAESARHVDEAHEPDDRRARQGKPLGADHSVGVRLHYLGLTIND